MRSFAAVAVVVLFSLTGCTRGSQVASEINLSFSSESVGGLANDLAVLVINVTGPGIKDAITYNWDHNVCVKGQPCAAPASISLSVPSGADRLIQVLAVFRDDSTGRMVFKYADLKKTLNSGSVEVELTPTPIGGATTEGAVAGRYLSLSASGVTGPTGKFDIKFKPKNAPAMTVITSYMFAGWFSGMALNGDARFEYHLNNQLLMGDVHLDSSDFVGAGSRVMKVDIPTHDRQQSENGVNYFEREYAQKYILGFFGPAAAARVACYDASGAVNLDHAYKVTSTIGTTKLIWDGAATSASPDGSYARVDTGGLPEVNASCESAVDFDSKIKFQHTQIGNGKDGLGGFRGPFKYQDLGNGWYDVVGGSVSGSDLSLNWQWLPGVAEDGLIKGAIILGRQRNASSDDGELYGMGDGIDCERARKSGFMQLGGVVAKSASSATVSVPGINAGNAGSYDIVVCPIMADNSLPPSGVKFHGMGGSGGGGSSAPVFKLVGSATVSDLSGAGIMPAMRLLKAHTFNGSHRLAVYANNRMLPFEDLTSPEIQIDGGPWMPAAKELRSYSGMSVGTIPLNSALRAAAAGTTLATLETALDSVVKFRVVLPAGQVLTSEAITMVGDRATAGGCSAPGSLQAVDQTSSSVLGGNSMITSIVNSDDSTSFRLRWAGCSPEVNAVPDYVAIGGAGTITPEGCFTKENDIARSMSNPFVWIIDPKDSAAEDCVISNRLITFFVPGSESVQFNGDHTIIHSATPSSFGLAATFDDLNAVGTNRFRYRMALLGASVPFSAHAILQNSDGRITNVGSGGILNDATSWLIGAIANWFSSPLPTGDDHLSAVTAGSTLDGPLRELKAVNGALSGSAALGVVADSDIVATSSARFNGGSPVFLRKKANTNLVASYVPSQNGNFVGSTVVDLGDFGPAAALTFAKVIALNNGDVFVVAQFGTTSFYRLGRFNHVAQAMDWASPFAQTGDIRDAAVVDMGGNNYRPVIVSYSGSDFRVKYGSFPSYNAGSWSGQSFIPVTEHVLSAFDGFLGMSDCMYPLIAVGYNGSNNLTHSVLDVVGDTVYPRPTSSINVANNNRMACAQVNNGSSYAIMAYSYSSQVNPQIAAFNNGTSACGGATDGELSISGVPLASSGFTPLSGGWPGIQGIRSGSSSAFLGAYRATGADVTQLKLLPMTCASGTLMLNSTVGYGSVAAPASSLNGLTIMKSGGNGDLDEIAVFGGSSQLYWMRSR